MCAKTGKGEREISYLVYERDQEKYQKLESILEEILQERDDLMSIHRISSMEGAMQYMEEYMDVFFVSWEDENAHGLFLAQDMRKYDKRMNIIPMAEKPVFLPEAWEMHASGYLIGDVTKEKVLDELEHLRYL